MPTATGSARRALHQACLCAKVCDDLRGENTKVLDLTAVTPVFDYFVVTNGTNRRQMVAIGDKADDVMAAAGSERLGMEGQEGATWILHDYGDVVLHIFDPETRRTYDLENLWADAKSIDWREALNLAGETETSNG
ncbi:MAG: ribosome silencing factor [Planctomycetota bacterium]|nr:ribosome silencing factor [Planctomycetaceae bacterium]MDQ3332466.1 ribosome silencing factor [Planctomycetota bacterium]